MWHSSYSASSLTPTYKYVCYGKHTHSYGERTDLLHQETSLIQGGKAGAR